MTDEQETGESYLWIAGLSVSCLGSLLCCIGLLLQKVAHERIEGTGKKYFLQPLWLLGISLMVSDTILDVLTFGMAPQSLLASLAALTLVYNSCLAPLVLGETIARLDIIAMIFICIGATTAVAGATKETPVYTNEMIRENWLRPMVIIYELGNWIFMFGLYYYLTEVIPLLPAIEKLSAEKSSQKETERASFDRTETILTSPDKNGLKNGDWSVVTSNGKSVTVSSSNGKKRKESKNEYEENTGKDQKSSAAAEVQKQFGTKCAILLATLAGCMGAQSVIFAKTIIELVKSTFEGENKFYVEFESYVYVAMLAFFLIQQASFLNSCLAAFDALLVVPMYQVAWIFFGILGGGVYFDEFKSFTVLQWIFFPLGALLTMFGVFLLTFRTASNEDANEDGRSGIDIELSSTEKRRSNIRRKTSLIYLLAGEEPKNWKHAIDQGKVVGEEEFQANRASPHLTPLDDPARADARSATMRDLVLGPQRGLVAANALMGGFSSPLESQQQQTDVEEGGRTTPTAEARAIGETDITI
eukprot:g963.t1